MELTEAIKRVSDKFVYTADKTGTFMRDNWFVMREQDGKYYGDCEDFSLTVMYLMAGGYLAMLLKLLVGEYKLHMTSSTGANMDHCVGSIGGVWFDNWTLSGNTRGQFFERTRQVYGNRISVFVIFSKLIMGKLFGKK
jgi:hypothetical protein